MVLCTDLEEAAALCFVDDLDVRASAAAGPDVDGRVGSVGRSGAVVRPAKVDVGRAPDHLKKGIKL